MEDQRSLVGCQHIQAKSLYKSGAGRHFLWHRKCDLGKVWNEWQYYLGWFWATFEDSFFHVFGFFWKCFSVCTEKMHNIKLRYYIFFIFWPQKHNKTSSNRAQFTINFVLFYWRHLLARLLYNDFGSRRVPSPSFGGWT